MKLKRDNPLSPSKTYISTTTDRVDSKQYYLSYNDANVSLNCLIGRCTRHGRNIPATFQDVREGWRCEQRHVLLQPPQWHSYMRRSPTPLSNSPTGMATPRVNESICI